MKGFMMRAYLSLTLLVVLLGICDTSGQTPTNAYDFLFLLNTDGRTTTYELRAWAGTDTTLATNVNNYTVVGSYSHAALQTQFPGSGSQARLTDVYVSPENGQYLMGAMRAIGPTGLMSPWAFSKAYKKADLTPPQTPNLAGSGWAY